MLKNLFLSLFILCQCICLHAREVKVLSLDGGGVRGVAPLKILKEMQKETGLKIHNEFEVFAGTSTGSIIAVFLASGFDIDDLLTDYEEMSAGVFSRGAFLTLFWPKYDQNMLKTYIVQNLEKMGYSSNATLGDLSKKVVVPVVELKDPKSGRWQMAIRENFTEEGKKVKIVDALLESTAAPTYFASHNGCVDGGLAMNDPSLAALMTAFNPDSNDLKDFCILSIGTGYDKDSVAGDEDRGISGWLTNFTGSNEGSVPLVELLLDVQDQVPAQVCSKLLGKSYMRFDFPLNPPIALDDYPKIPELIKHTEEYIQSHPKHWAKTQSWLQQKIL